MAFMALFGWIFIPLMFVYYMVQLLMAPLRLAAAHPLLVNAAAAGLLAVNLLALFLLLRVRRRRKQAGRPKGFWTLLGVLWEAAAVILYVLFLALQPLERLA